MLNFNFSINCRTLFPGTSYAWPPSRRAPHPMHRDPKEPHLAHSDGTLPLDTSGFLHGFRMFNWSEHGRNTWWRTWSTQNHRNVHSSENLWERKHPKSSSESQSSLFTTQCLGPRMFLKHTHRSSVQNPPCSVIPWRKILAHRDTLYNPLRSPIGIVNLLISSWKEIARLQRLQLKRMSENESE